MRVIHSRHFNIATLHPVLSNSARDVYSTFRRESRYWSVTCPIYCHLSYLLHVDTQSLYREAPYLICPYRYNVARWTFSDTGLIHMVPCPPTCILNHPCPNEAKPLQSTPARGCWPHFTLVYSSGQACLVSLSSLHFKSRGAQDPNQWCNCIVPESQPGVSLTHFMLQVFWSWQSIGNCTQAARAAAA